MIIKLQDILQRILYKLDYDKIINIIKSVKIIVRMTKRQ